jgi:hypothetical protein
MAAESIWPGMFQAEAGTGNTTSARSTSDAISDTVASYPLPARQFKKGGEAPISTAMRAVAGINAT